MMESSRLRNRGYSGADVEERRHIIEQQTKCDLSPIADYSFNSEKASKNIENMIGVTQVPLGFAGPVLIKGDFAKGRYFVPLATTEGALVASISRGMSVLTAAGGSKVKIFNDIMTRAPVFRVDGIDHSVKVIEWINKNRHLLDDAVSETTTHGKLLEIEPFPNGRNLHIRLKFSTGQDPAHVVEASMSMTTCENISDGLYIAVRMPSIEIGTVGGGTKLPSQSAALKMIDCFGEGKSCKFGEIVATTILAGELSTLGAQAAGHLGMVHKTLGR